MKKALALLLLLLMAVSLCGCGKTAISCDAFRTNMKSLGYSVIEVSDTLDKELFRDGAVGSAEDEDPLVHFYELSDDDLARSFFASVKDDYVSEAGPGSTTSVSSSSYEYYSHKTGEFFLIARVGNTVMFGGSSLEKADALKEIFDTMGYR